MTNKRHDVGASDLRSAIFDGQFNVHRNVAAATCTYDIYSDTVSQGTLHERSHGRIARLRFSLRVASRRSSIGPTFFGSAGLGRSSPAICWLGG